MTQLKILVSGALANNVYILHDDQKAVVIDPENYGVVKGYLKTKNLKCEAVLLTHGHYDHVGGAAALKRDGAKIYIHMLDSPFTQMGDSMPVGFKSYESFDADVLIEDGWEYKLNDTVIRAIHTPGHSPGSVCYLVDGKIKLADWSSLKAALCENPSKAAAPIGTATESADTAYPRQLLLSGDTLFCGGMGRTDLPGGNHSAMMRSLKKLFDMFADELPVLPGHDAATTIGNEK